MELGKNKGNSPFRGTPKSNDGFGFAGGGVSRKKSGGKTKKRKPVKKKEEEVNTGGSMEEQLASKYQKGIQLIKAGEQMIQEVNMMAQKMQGGPNSGGNMA